MHDLRSRVNEVSVRVRASPFGQDRYNRYYWILPHHSGVFVEGIESGGVNNPAIKQAPTLNRIPSPSGSGRCASPSKHLDEIRFCVQDMVEAVARSHSVDCGVELDNAYADVKVERSNLMTQELEATAELLRAIPATRASKAQANKKMKPIPIEMQQGWWSINDPTQLDEIPPHLHHRGIRERQLNRTLTKHVDHIKRAAYQPGKSKLLFSLKSV